MSSTKIKFGCPLVRQERKGVARNRHQASIEDIASSGDRERLASALLDHDHGDVEARQILDEPKGVRDLGGGERGRWLIQNEEAWPGHESAGEGELLPLAA